MDISTEQICFCLFVLSEGLALIPESFVKSNGFVHTIVCLVKTCNDVFTSKKIQKNE